MFLKPSIPLDSCGQVGFNFKVESLFFLMDEKLTFLTIILLGLGMWNWSSEAALNTQKT